MPIRHPSRRLLSFAAVLGLVVLGACGPATIPPGDTIVDRDETQNRSVHQFNLAVDSTVVSPVSNAYGEVVPQPIRSSISNFSENLDQPLYVVNNILQFRIEDALYNTTRFVVNSTLGIGGLFDPATEMGLVARETDFGETLHVYGVPEGAYTELPLIGPSTSRHAVGRVVDFAMNPTRFLIDAPESDYVTAAGVLSVADTRYELGDVIDGVLYESADSYAQSRSIYLQTRRFALSRGAPQSLGFDLPGDDGFVEGFDDPFVDPYVDPYGN